MVTSPNFPDNYPFYTEKNYTIEVEQGLLLLLEFTDFRIVSERDENSQLTCKLGNMSIIDSNGTTLMDKRCGWEKPKITSVSNVVEIIFRSGDLTGWDLSWSPARRWSLNWTAVFARGELNSPNYPNSPPANLDEKYTIEVDQGLILILEIAMDLQGVYDYYETYDYICESHLTIIDGDGTTLNGAGCGEWFPGMNGFIGLTTRSNNVTVHFHTDEDPADEFFTINWLAVKPRATI